MGRRLAVPLAVLGLVILASLGFAATRSSNEPAAQPADATAPTTTPNVVTPSPSQSQSVRPTATALPRPTPTPLALDAAGQDLPPPIPALTADAQTGVTRAGFVCGRDLLTGIENEPAGRFVFTVPDNMWALDCQTLDYQHPTGAPCCGSPLTVEVQAMNPVTVIRELETIPEIDVVAATWVEVGDRGAWSVDLRFTGPENPPHDERWLIVDAGGTHSVLLHSSGERIDLDAERVDASYQELVDSLHIWHEWDYPAARSADPHCVGDDWIIDVPAAWFTYGACDGSESEVQLNTSDMADIALQCECFGPLWISKRFLMSPGDPGVTVVSETTERRSDGTPIWIVESVVENDVISGLELRSVTIEFPEGPITVVANRTPSHAGPLHTWSDTLAAQTAVVDGLRRWRDPACVQSGRLFRTTIDTRLMPSTDSTTAMADIPAGTVVHATGCTESIGPIDWTEVHVPPLPDGTGGRLAGWVRRTHLTGRSPVLCTRDSEPFDDDTNWEQTVTGDFNGDGEIDTMRLRGNPFDGSRERVRDLPLAEATVAYANGTVATGPLGSGQRQDGSVGSGLAGSDDPFAGSLWGIGSNLQVVRPVGLDRDLVILADPFQRGAYTSLLFVIGFFDCEPKVVGQLSWGASVGNQLSYCLAPTPFGTIIRSLHTVATIHQAFAAQMDVHLQWSERGLVPLAEFPIGSEPMCGERHEPFADPATWAGLPGPLEGVHGLSLQWLGTDSANWGEIAFRTVGPDRYRVEGSQAGELLPDGTTDGKLTIYGIIEQRADGDLHFEGRIDTDVSYLNDGDTCNRVGGQDFRSTEGRRYWRMQDQINCDGVSSDYIDIYFD